MDKDIENILDKLPEKIRETCKTYFIQGKIITEIRLRFGFNSKIYADGIFEEIPDTYINKKEISDIFLSFCNYTISAFENQICNGFITLNNGHRIGLGGKFNYESEKVVLEEIWSLNIRFNLHKNTVISDEYSTFSKGLLIVGKPHSGKTTFIRNLCYKLSDKNIVICDERNELYDNNLNCDYISGIKKHTAIMHAVRTMNPDIIACDEIGDVNEAEQILSGVNSGVKFICSVHGDILEDIYCKPNINLLLINRVFDKIILLSKENNCFIVKEVINV